MISHTVLAKGLDYIARSANFNGRLLDHDGEVLQTWEDESRSGDVLELGALLRAAHVNLDGKKTFWSFFFVDTMNTDLSKKETDCVFTILN
jgi:hypothetical protein